jgi:serine/threonine protein kinase
MDYGFSIVSDEYGRGSSLGCTPKFAAPELFLPNPYQLLPADVYSLGMTLCWLLKAGRDYAAKMKISSGAWALVESMTNRDPTKRPNIRQVLSLLTLVQAAYHRKVVKENMTPEEKEQVKK